MSSIGEAHANQRQDKDHCSHRRFYRSCCVNAAAAAAIGSPTKLLSPSCVNITETAPVKRNDVIAPALKLNEANIPIYTDKLISFVLGNMVGSAALVCADYAVVAWVDTG
jgi:hypothetical protein